MTNRDYDRMNDQELREYFLANKYDQSALQAYLARRNNQSREIITTVGDTDFDLKIEQAIEAKLKTTRWYRKNEEKARNYFRRTRMA